MLDGRALPYPPDTRGPPPGRYAAALVITAVAILSQYVLPEQVAALRPVYQNLGTGLLIVYGIPIAAFALLVGAGPLRRFAASMGKASIEGLRWYSLLSLLGLLVAAVLLGILGGVDPSALHALTKPNPELAQAQSDPWFWVAFAFAIGAVEETIFRGWVFGYWVARGDRDWFPAAVGSSALFAGVHLYYGITYGVASVALYPTIFLLGLSFAIVYRYSGGNLVVVALLHGANDSAAFLTIVSPAGALAFHYGIILLGLAIAAVVYMRSWTPPLPPPVAAWPSGGPPLPVAVPYSPGPAPGEWPPPPPPPTPPAAPPGPAGGAVSLL